MAALLGPVVLCGTSPTISATQHAGPTLEQGRSLARTLASARVSLMRGHGAVVVGRSVRQTVMAAIYAELNAGRSCKAPLSARSTRYPTPRSNKPAKMLSEPLAAERAWTTWAARVC